MPRLIVINPGVQEPLRILYDKGYKTRFSCESHNPEDTVHICFEWDYGFGDVLPLPEGFKKAFHGGYRYCQCFVEGGARGKGHRAREGGGTTQCG